jgi:hypothetical protein
VKLNIIVHLKQQAPICRQDMVVNLRVTDLLLPRLKTTERSFFLFFHSCTALLDNIKVFYLPTDAQ